MTQNNFIHLLGDKDIYVKYKTMKDQKFQRLQMKVITVVTAGQVWRSWD